MQKVIEGTEVGHAVPVDLVNPDQDKKMSKVNVMSGEDTKANCVHRKLFLNQLQDKLHNILGSERDGSTMKLLV